MKHIKHWLMTVAVLLCSFTASAHHFEVDSIYYNVTSSVDLTVGVTYQGPWSSSYPNEYSGMKTIPSTVTNDGKTYRVTSIGNHAFSGCNNLTSIIIPESIKSIGDYAFEDCRSLSEVHIGSIEAWCNIDFGNFTSNPMLYANNLYVDGKNVTDLNIPNTVTTIKKYAFYGCSGLTSVSMANSVNSIGEYVFGGCYNLISITIPVNVTSIGNSAFFNCINLSDVHINSIESWCNIDFGNGDSNPLSYADNLYLNGEPITEYSIPNSVTAIEDYAFSFNSLTSIAVPESVTNIGHGAFYDTPWYNNQPDGVIYAGRVLYNYKGTMKENTELEVKEGTISISPYAFADCKNLASVIIPNSVMSIGDGAFWGCSNLTSVIIPNSVTSIGYASFYGCSNLTSITIPESVTSIGYESFRNCSSLTSLSIPNSVLKIESNAFTGCRNIKEIVFEDGVNTMSVGRSGDSGALFASCSLEYVYLGRDLTYEISPFRKKTTLTTAVIGDSVTKISSEAFRGCTNLSSIIIPNSVIFINGSAFDGCTSLSSAVIGNNVTSIGDRAFAECNNLESVAIGKGVTSIEGLAFYGCPKLSTIFNVSRLSINKGSRDNGYVGYYAQEIIEAEYFKNNLYFFTADDGEHYLRYYTGKDTNLILPDDYKGEKYVIESNVFADRDSLNSIIISEGVRAVHNNAFKNCINLTEIVVGSYVDMFGDDAFAGCTKVKELTVLGSVMPYIPSEVFTSITLRSPVPLEAKEFANAVYRNCELHVPEGSIGRYQAADVWRNFWYIYEFDPAGIEDLTVDEDSDAPIYDMKAIRVNGSRSTLPAGMYIQNGKKFVVM